MSSNALAAKDVNTQHTAAAGVQDPKAAAADMKSMEYHRQVLQSKIDNSEECAAPPHSPRLASD